MHVLAEEGVLSGEPAGEVRLRAARGCFVTCAAMTFLCAWGLRYRERGGTITADGDDSLLSYLARMDLFTHLDIPFEEDFDRRNPEGRFMPLRLIAGDEDVFETTNSVLELVLRQFEDGQAFVPALEWAVNEATDNILRHAEAPAPGVVCAQYVPKAHRLDVAICDAGRGITASLEGVLEPWEGPGDAVKQALQRGVTRDPEIGQGNGLAGALEIAKTNSGAFHLWTDDIVFSTTNGEDGRFAKLPPLPGTGVAFALDTRRPVDLSDTFIGAPACPYIDAEAMRLETSDDGIKVAEDCVSTGTRGSARRLRRKIASVLPEMDESLVLNFEGVERASSSFLDELLGRLAAEFGTDAFEQRVRLVNMPEQVVDMANVVIEQRLDQQPL